MKLNNKLAEMERKAGICEEWFTRLMSTEDKDKLIKMYLEGIDFCLSNEYPDNEFIRRHFVGTCEAYGIYLDEQIATLNSMHVVALGCCTGTAEYTDFAVGQVFVKHTGKLTITASGNSFIMVDVFDEAQIEIQATDNAKVCVNQYGGNISEKKDGNAVVKVIRKQSKTY